MLASWLHKAPEQNFLILGITITWEVFYILFFLLFFFYGSIIALWCYFSSCWTTKWISDTYAYVPSFLSRPPTTTPTPLSHPSSHHRAASWTPGARHQVPISDLVHTWQCLCVKATLSTHPTLLFPHCVHISILDICIAIPGEFIVKHRYWLTLHRGSHSVGLGSGPNMGPCFKVLRFFSQQPSDELLCHEIHRRGCWVQTGRMGEAHRAGHVCAGPSEAVWDWEIVFGVVMYTWNKIQKFKRISLDRLIFLFLLGPSPVLLSGANTLSSSCLYHQRYSTQLSIRNLSVW